MSVPMWWQHAARFLLGTVVGSWIESWLIERGIRRIVRRP